MIKNYFYLVLIFFFYSAGAQVLTISDPNFKARLLTASSINSVAKDLSGNPVKIDRNNNGLIETGEALNISYLDLSHSQIMSLEGINSFVNVVYLDCKINELSSLDVSHLNKLVSLNCNGNKINSLSLSASAQIETLNCRENEIGTLKVDGFTKLKSLICDYNKLTNLSLINCVNLSGLTFSSNPITDINVSGCTSLTSLDCSSMQLNSLDVSGCTLLNFLNCAVNKLSVLNVKGLNNLETLYCSNNQIKDLDISNLPNLQVVECQYNDMVNLTAVNCVKLNQLNFVVNLLSVVNLSGCSSLVNVDCSNSSGITSLNVSNCTSLTNLLCGNNDISILNLEGLNNLAILSCYNNELDHLDVSHLAKLQSLDFSGNKLISLDLKGLNNLKEVRCRSNNFSVLEFKDLPNIELIDCTYGKVTNLELSNLPKLTTLYCYNNTIEALNFKGLPNLYEVVCENNSLKELDFSENYKLSKLYISDNPIEFLNLKNGSKLSEFRSMNLYLMKYACLDEFEIDIIKNELNSSKAEINTYCSFTPGGIFYEIKGNQKLDAEKNGCDTSDANYPNLNFSITDGTNKGNIISDISGNYAIAVGAGTHTIVPILENPDYYEVSPTSLSVTFPAESISFSQNFCVKPKGAHPDLEVTILALNPARPGFDVTYKLVFKNKGNQVESGAVSLGFNDSIFDFVAASPVVSSQNTNKLFWEYLNLKPLETREITVTLNLNSPMETPAVNSGDRLSFEALITPEKDDEKPVDNSFALRQTVVGSYDPNDKTCLEGDVVTPELIGEYVHYLIRFENTGTYPAENIVVKDLIDVSKFDLSTLVPTGASHSYITKISGDNKVEFIFEKINLPFDNAHNDGYIAFKIKTLPTLKTGDSFTNEANIYFDYNFPILTNKATSTFKTLGTQDFEFSNYFNVYPNPAANVLNIASKSVAEVVSMSVYDILGQLVIAIPNAQNTSVIDVSNLRTGNYILKVKTEKGTSGVKFIKK